jgi:hypothetical protein
MTFGQKCQHKFINLIPNGGTGFSLPLEWSHKSAGTRLQYYTRVDMVDI